MLVGTLSLRIVSCMSYVTCETDSYTQKVHYDRAQTAATVCQLPQPPTDPTTHLKLICDLTLSAPNQTDKLVGGGLTLLCNCFR